MAVARLSSDGYAILPVLWMTSCFYLIERMDQNRRRRVYFAQCARWRHQGEVCRLRLHVVVRITENECTAMMSVQSIVMKQQDCYMRNR